MYIPQVMLKQLYTIGSLISKTEGVSFTLKNRLKDAHLSAIKKLKINDQDVNLNSISIRLDSGETVSANALHKEDGFSFSLGASLQLHIDSLSLPEQSSHQLDIYLKTKPFGDIHLSLKDKVKTNEPSDPGMIPRDPADDLSPGAIKTRQQFVQQQTGAKPEKLFAVEENNDVLAGNIEHFIGMAQVPVGLAGPIIVNGEHAKGEFYVPLATTEGTLAASYNRGMKLLNACGGVTVTVVDDCMQRAPVFVFNSARHANEFAKWVNENIELIRKQANATDPFINLRDIQIIKANKFTFLRFNFTTGDAAGQNMVGRATFVACSWILERYPDVANFYLESNMATDKKASHINILNTRGKRVVAEATIKKSELLDTMRVDPKQIDAHSRVAAVGSFLSGANNTGLHAANGIAAMFIATGQDAANVAESSTGILYSEITEEGDLYLSITLPSLIVATCGGGTGLGTQQECLEILDCVGPGKVQKFAEIVGAVVLAGEISLASAISSLDWVPSHEELGRN